MKHRPQMISFIDLMLFNTIPVKCVSVCVGMEREREILGGMTKGYKFPSVCFFSSSWGGYHKWKSQLPTKDRYPQSLFFALLSFLNVCFPSGSSSIANQSWQFEWQSMSWVVVVDEMVGPSETTNQYLHSKPNVAEDVLLQRPKTPPNPKWNDFLKV